MKRYPLAELIRASGMTEHRLSQRVGLVGTPLIRAREHGLIESAADRYACRAGLVPWLVWSDWLADLEVKCADVRCAVMFVPAPRQKYCCPAHATRVAKRNYARRRYQSDPVTREAKKAKSREYGGATRRARKLYQQAYYQENRVVLLEKKAAYREANREQLRVKQAAWRARGKAAA